MLPAAQINAPRVSRQSLAAHPGIWRAQAVSLSLVALVTALLGLEGGSPQVMALAGALAVCAVPFFATSPPPSGSWPSHLSLASVYVLIGAAEFAMAPDWAVPLGGAMFIAPLAVIRAATHRQLVGHLAAAGVCLIGPSLWLSHDVFGVLTVVALVFGVWTLTACAMYVLSAIEHQGDKLAELLRVDPLTGVGNQRLLTERLEAEIEVHARTRQSFSIVAADLFDFTGLNERLGRERGDVLLSTAARLAASLAEPHDTVTRAVDDELCLVLPGADALAASQYVERLTEALGQVGTGDDEAPVLSAAFGIATFPRDGLDASHLLDVVHKRLGDDQQRAPATGSADVRGDESPAPELIDTATDGDVRGLRRGDLAVHPWLWRYTQIAYAAFFVLAAATIAASGADGLGDLAILVTFAAFTAGLLTRRTPVPPNSIEGHALLATSYTATAAAFWLLDADDIVALTGAMFIGPFLSIRTTSRRQLGWHLGAAMLMFALAAAGIAIDGGDVRGQLLSIALIAPAIWSLAISCMLALELAESQGRSLEQLVELDHVTGVGNRHMLDRVLTDAAATAKAGDGGLAVVVIELVETFENSRLTSEALLNEAAQALHNALGPNDTLTRRRGHEFAIVLPGAGPREVDHATTVAFAALGALAHRIECLYASATLPDDGETAGELLRVVDVRLANGGNPVPVRQL